MQLPRYIDKLTNEMKESGNLEGILLTGLTKDGVDLMESYVDRTGDVQTASFCMLKVKTVSLMICRLIDVDVVSHLRSKGREDKSTGIF